MEPGAYVDSFRRSGSRLADAAEGRLDRPVPACPGWSMADLVRHAAQVCDWWGQLTAGGPDAPVDPADHVPTEPPADDELVGWFRAMVEATAAQLAALDPATPCWTWDPRRQDVGFVQRRLAHEMAVHAWDAADAVGEPAPIDAALAVDGVDEVLDVFVPARADAAGRELSGHLHATDAEGEWVLRLGDDAVVVERAHAKGDVAIRGGASDLVLLLWGRRTVSDEGFEVFGDDADVAELLQRLRVG